MSKVFQAINYLNKFSKKEGLYLFPNLPEQSTAVVNAPEDIDIRSFLILAKSLDCKVLYYETKLFTADDFDGYIEYLDREYRAEEIELEDNEWYKKINQFVTIKIAFFYKEVSHVFQLKEDYLEELEQGSKNFHKNNFRNDPN